MLTGISLSYPDLEDTIDVFLTDVQQIWSYCEQQVGLAHHKDRKQGNTAILAPYKYFKKMTCFLALSIFQATSKVADC